MLRQIIKDCKLYNEYYVTLDNIDIGIIDDELTRKSINEYLDDMLEFLDCSRVYQNNVRVVQTISYVYRANISKFFYVLDMLEDINEIEEYINKLYIRHKANIDFEEENPPIIYESKKKNKKTSSPVKKEKQEKITKKQQVANEIQAAGGVKFKLNIKK